MRIALTSAILLMLVSTTAAAQTPDVVYEKRQVVNFAPEEMQGDTQGPDGTIFYGPNHEQATRLIHIRDNFRPEILRSLRAR